MVSEKRIVIGMLLQLMKEHKEKCKKSDCEISNLLIIQNLKENGKWGGLKSGKKLTKPVPLFPRIDPSKMSQGA